MSRNWFKSGEWNVWCMVCNRKIKSGTALKRWDGLIVCPEDYENRQPLDFLRTRQERITVPFSAPTTFQQFDGPDYPSYPFCTQEGASGVAGFVVAGCFRPGLGFPNGLPVPQPEIPDELTSLPFVFMNGNNWILMNNNQLVTVSLDD